MNLSLMALGWTGGPGTDQYEGETGQRRPEMSSSCGGCGGTWAGQPTTNNGNSGASNDWIATGSLICSSLTPSLLAVSRLASTLALLHAHCSSGYANAA